MTETFSELGIMVNGLTKEARDSDTKEMQEAQQMPLSFQNTHLFFL